MNIKIFKCPICEENLVISELRCIKCDLRMRKDVSLCEFCRLSEEDYQFLKVFLLTQGKITEIEKVLNISYPTIKAKIDSLLKNLKLSPYEETKDPIEALAQGKLSVDEAITILRQRRKK